MAVFPNTSNMKLHQTGEPWHLSYHGDKTPAKPHVSSTPLRAYGAQSGVQGGTPCLSPWRVSRRRGQRR